MDKALFTAVVFLGLLASGAAPGAQFDFGFKLAGLDCGGILYGKPGDRLQVQIYVTASQRELSPRQGLTGADFAFAGRGAGLHFLPESLFMDEACTPYSAPPPEKFLPAPVFFCYLLAVDPDEVPDSGPLAGKPQGEGVVGHKR